MFGNKYPSRLRDQHARQVHADLWRQKRENAKTYEQWQAEQASK